MPKPSPQFLIAAAASVLAMSAFVLSSPAMTSASGSTPGLLPIEAGFDQPQLPALFLR